MLRTKPVCCALAGCVLTIAGCNDQASSDALASTDQALAEAGHAGGPSPASDNHGRPPKDPAEKFATSTPIKHLVVVFGENISFDHYFGTYPNAAGFTPAPGTPAAKRPRTT